MWNCAVDDPIFETINNSQWRWYAQMFFQEEEDEYKKELNLFEYHASFWNAEGVKRIREIRERKENPHIDKEFEEVVKKGDFKENPLIKALQKMRQDTNLQDKDIESQRPKKTRRMKAPIDLDKLAKTTKI